MLILAGAFSQSLIAQSLNKYAWRVSTKVFAPPSKDVAESTSHPLGFEGKTHSLNFDILVEKSRTRTAMY